MISVFLFHICELNFVMMDKMLNMRIILIIIQKFCILLAFSYYLLT